MRKRIPASTFGKNHSDYAIVDAIEVEILKASGGVSKLSEFYSEMLRDEIDKLIDTPNTDRRAYRDLEKVEKTYIGTRVEIRLRKFWGYPKGYLDLRIQHVDVDIKHTMEGGWMFPPEAVGQVCVLSAADEDSAKCYLGLVIAHKAYLSSGPGNRDAKLQLTASGWTNIQWLIFGLDYPKNFWKTLDLKSVDYIFSGQSGVERICRLFKTVPDVPVARKIIVDTARQLDSLKRIRKNGGARDQMLKDGFLLLSGKYDRELIDELKIGPCSSNEFVAHHIAGAAEIKIAAKFGIYVP